MGSPFSMSIRVFRVSTHRAFHDSHNMQLIHIRCNQISCHKGITSRAGSNLLFNSITLLLTSPCGSVSSKPISPRGNIDIVINSKMMNPLPMECNLSQVLPFWYICLLDANNECVVEIQYRAVHILPIIVPHSRVIINGLI